MDRYAVFGNPIGHSKSPIIHRSFAEQTQQNLSYEAILAPVDGFADAWRQFVAAGGKGANVTVPFKEQAFKLADQCTLRALQAQAVNTLYIAEGRLIGDNTDGAGLVADLIRLGAQLQEAKVLILGAGGASRGVIGPLLDAGVVSVHVANRTPEKAYAVANAFNDQVSASGFADIPNHSWSIVINATSAGLSGSRPEIASSHLANCQFAYDMLYGNQPTDFLLWAQQLGVKNTADGLGMLVSQAAESFHIWRGVKPMVAPVLQQLQEMMRS